MKLTNYTFALMLAAGFAACTPDSYEVLDVKPVDMGQVASLTLRLNHSTLLADGHAQLEFLPLLTTQAGFEVPDNRVDHSLIEYTTSDGMVLDKCFSTSDKALVGKTLTVTAKVKGSSLASNAVSFTVADPSRSTSLTQRTLPVVFHLIQTESEVNNFGGEISDERIYQVLDKINNTFSGAVSHNPVGVDTKIRFRAAEFDPEGKKLAQAGIHRVYVSSVSDAGGDLYNTFIKNQGALWDPEKYLNIWLISDRENNEYSKFFYTVSRECTPRYQKASAPAPDYALDLATALPVVPEAWTPQANEVGVVYRLSSILTLVRTWGEKNENELVTALGHYFGLKSTWSASAPGVDANCPDVQAYQVPDSQGYKENKTPYKQQGNVFFLAENIMDDPVGLHRSVSLSQALRAHWVLENCPGHQAWKSNFAFTGQ